MEMTKVFTSKKGQLKWRDALRGAYMAAGTAMAVVIQTSIDAGHIEFKWKEIAMSGLGAAFIYLLKNGIWEPTKVVAISDSKEVEKDIKEAVR